MNMSPIATTPNEDETSPLFQSTADLVTHYQMDEKTLRGVILNNNLWIHAEDLCEVMDVAGSDISGELSPGQVMTLSTLRQHGAPPTAFIVTQAVEDILRADHGGLLDEYLDNVATPTLEAIVKTKRAEKKAANTKGRLVSSLV